MVGGRRLKARAGGGRPVKDRRGRWRTSETEYLTGDVVRVGQEHGPPMPLNARVAAVVAEIERGERRAAWDNLRALEGLASARLPA
ncbi:MAG TPA: ketopantoate reductase C-terminal domain-containing protein [Chloroflexota bacterium]|nr:ketopantoate reductase C-terminal domain-containing protein [Chloroflexota bacterium]